MRQAPSSPPSSPEGHGASASPSGSGSAHPHPYHFGYVPHLPFQGGGHGSGKSGDFSISTGLQFVLGFVVLAGLPLSAWLYIQTHVDARIGSAIAQNNQMLTQSIERQKATIERHEDSIESLRDYAFNLCTAIRRLDQEFVCGSTYYRERSTSFVFSNRRR